MLSDLLVIVGVEEGEVGVVAPGLRPYVVLSEDVSEHEVQPLQVLRTSHWHGVHDLREAIKLETIKNEWKCPFHD